MDLTIIKKIFTDSFKIDSFDYPPADVLTFACDNDRYIDYLGKSYSPLIDTITDDLVIQGLSVVSISRVASTIKGEKSHGRVFSPEGAFARALISKRMKAQLSNNKGYPYSNMEERIWRKIIAKVKPKVVIGIMPSRELCKVCHEKGIWVADMQHGVISKQHPWYAPENRGEEPCEWIPHFLCWDTDAVNAIKSWAKTDVEIHQIGNPWINRFINLDQSDVVLGYLKSKYKISPPDKNKPRILISISWGNYNIPGNNFISKELETFILSNTDNYEFIMRLHPNMLNGFATNEGDDFFDYYERTYAGLNIDWEECTEAPLPLLLSNIDLHITWNSSVCIEAAILGKPSLALDFELLEGQAKELYYSKLTESGYLTKINSNLYDIKEWVNTNLNSSLKPYDFREHDYKNLIKNLVSRIKE